MNENQLAESLYKLCKLFIADYEMSRRPPGPMAATISAVMTSDTTKCPRHGTILRTGKFGMYCPAKEMDPAHSNKNGYCNYHPKGI